MTDFLSTAKSTYLNVFSGIYSRGWMRNCNNPWNNSNTLDNVITIQRSVRDIDGDRSRMYLDTYMPLFESPTSLSLGKMSSIAIDSISTNSPVIYDISPSGSSCISLLHQLSEKDRKVSPYIEFITNLGKLKRL